jgi:hypothetical protein
MEDVESYNNKNTDSINTIQRMPLVFQMVKCLWEKSDSWIHEKWIPPPERIKIVLKRKKYKLGNMVVEIGDTTLDSTKQNQQRPFYELKRRTKMHKDTDKFLVKVRKDQTLLSLTN